MSTQHLKKRKLGGEVFSKLNCDVIQQILSYFPLKEYLNILTEDECKLEPNFKLYMNVIEEDKELTNHCSYDIRFIRYVISIGKHFNKFYIINFVHIHSSFECFKLLLDAGDYDRSSIVDEVCHRGTNQMVCYLIKKGIKFSPF